MEGSKEVGVFERTIWLKTTEDLWEHARVYYAQNGERRRPPARCRGVRRGTVSESFVIEMGYGSVDLGGGEMRFGEILWIVGVEGCGGWEREWGCRRGEKGG